MDRPDQGHFGSNGAWEGLIEAERFAALLAGYPEQMDRMERFDPEVVSLLRNHEVWRAVHGSNGVETDLTTQCRWIEALASRCTSTAVLVQSQLTVGHTILLSGSPMAGELLEEMRNGTIWGWGLTEAEAGSDILSMKTTAHQEGSEYVIRGSKRFISNAGIATRYLVFARTKAERGSKSISAFVVPSDSLGLSIARYEHKMGLRASPTGDVVLDDVRVPASSAIGNIGEGVGLALSTLRWSRPLIGAVSVGVARGAFEELLRVVGPSNDELRKLTTLHQAKGHKIAELLMQVFAARALLYDVTTRADSSGELPAMWEASSTKAFCSEVAMKVASEALEVAGREAVAVGAPLQRYYRDAKILQIFEGTNQIQKNAIMKELGLVNFAVR
ncbi:MAG: acyl-CoA dehydrogenase family protein [Actinomycetota bacterium]|nr:acyl-CoA dehydrogenase family protein [Actinomycetota bacterium]